MISKKILVLVCAVFLTINLIEPDPTAFKPVSKVEMLEGSMNWAPLVLADGRLIIRDQGKMFCLKVVR